ncbi:MAG TPA: VOC family protein [Verrucomicrobiae bacterium]|nr:VOC family protein [Verrucomicrobiae bacterium]
MKHRQIIRASKWIQLSVCVVTLLAGHVSAQTEVPPLTTIDNGPRLPGKFVWADLVTDDAATVQKFYSQLFGWTFRDVGDYTIGFNDERPLCGIFQRQKPADKPEAKPHWVGFISVTSINRAQREVTESGGKILAAPKKIPKRGEQALCADPEGAVFGIIKSSSGDPQDFMADTGDWIWMQLLSHDAKKASEFYQKIAQYDIFENTASNRLSDYILVSNGFARATVRTIPGDAQQVRPKWLPFVRVEDIGKSVALAKQLGGKILFEPKPEIFNGKLAVIADPTGAAIGLLEWSDELVKEVQP